MRWFMLLVQLVTIYLQLFVIPFSWVSLVVLALVGVALVGNIALMWRAALK